MHPLAAIAALIDFVFPPRADELVVRRADEAQVRACITPVLIESVRPATTALSSFSDDLVRACIREAKYHASRKAKRLLGAMLTEYLLELGADTYEEVVIVPIPLSRKRRAERGFNQCEAIVEEALRMGPELPLLIESALLTRVRDTEHQTRLSRRERLLNVKDAFTATRDLDAQTTYVLFDDVVTTGATMQAAARALRARGARHILPIALATAR